MLALAFEEGLAGSLGSPDLGEVVPVVALVQCSEGVRNPAANEVRPQGGRAGHEDAAPVVAHEIDRATDGVLSLDLLDQPVGVVVHARRPRGGAGAPEPGKAWGEDLGVEGARELGPDRWGFGVAVDENCGHVSSIGRRVGAPWSAARRSAFKRRALFGA